MGGQVLLARIGCQVLLAGRYRLVVLAVIGGSIYG
jgi:hypothetical protein